MNYIMAPFMALLVCMIHFSNGTSSRPHGEVLNVVTESQILLQPRKQCYPLFLSYTSLYSCMYQGWSSELFCG